MVYAVIDDQSNAFSGFKIYDKSGKSIRAIISADEVFKGFGVLGTVGHMGYLQAWKGQFDVQNGGILELNWTNFKGEPQVDQIYFEKIENEWISFALNLHYNEVFTKSGKEVFVPSAFMLDEVSFIQDGNSWGELRRMLDSEEISRIDHLERLDAGHAAIFNMASGGKESAKEDPSYQSLIGARDVILQRNLTQILHRAGYPATEQEAINSAK